MKLQEKQNSFFKQLVQSSLWMQGVLSSQGLPSLPCGRWHYLSVTTWAFPIIHSPAPSSCELLSWLWFYLELKFWHFICFSWVSPICCSGAHLQWWPPLCLTWTTAAATSCPPGGHWIQVLPAHWSLLGFYKTKMQYAVTWWKLKWLLLVLRTPYQGIKSQTP